MVLSAILPLVTWASSSLAAEPAFLKTHVCGWFAYQPSGNVSLTDATGIWDIESPDNSNAGAYGDYFPKFAKHADGTSSSQWVANRRDPNEGYGYGCACADLLYTKSTHNVERVMHAKAQELSQCRADKHLVEPHLRPASR